MFGKYGVEHALLLESNVTKSKQSKLDLVNKKYGHNIITIGVPASLHEIKPIIAFGHIPRETGKGKSLK